MRWCFRGDGNFKRLKPRLLVEEPGRDELRKGFALVRQAFGVNPLLIEDKNELAELMAEAIWLKRNEMDMMEAAFESALVKVLNAAFGGAETN